MMRCVMVTVLLVGVLACGSEENSGSSTTSSSVEQGVTSASSHAGTPREPVANGGAVGTNASTLSETIAAETTATPAPATAAPATGAVTPTTSAADTTTSTTTADTSTSTPEVSTSASETAVLPQGESGASTTGAATTGATSIGSDVAVSPGQLASDGTGVNTPSLPQAGAGVATTKPPRLILPSSGPLLVKPGEHVLTPSWSSYERFVGTGRSSFVYFGSTVVESSTRETRVRDHLGAEFTLPNVLVVPIPAGVEVARGDLLLTWWQSGSGMQRAIVTGGFPTAPTVRYLDLNLDNPSGVARKKDTLAPNTFVKLKAPLDIGSSVACKRGDGWAHGVVMGKPEGRLLVLGFASRLSVEQRADCVGLPVTFDTSLKRGAKVWVPFIGRFREAEVDRIDATFGRVYVVFEFGGETRKLGAAFMDVATHLGDKAPDALVVNPSPEVVPAGAEVVYGAFSGPVSGSILMERMTLALEPARLSGQLSGRTLEGRPWSLDLSGGVSDATFSGSGKRGDVTLKVSGSIVGERATGAIVGSVQGQPVTVTFSLPR